MSSYATASVLVEPLTTFSETSLLSLLQEAGGNNFVFLTPWPPILVSVATPRHPLQQWHETACPLMHNCSVTQKNLHK